MISAAARRSRPGLRGQVPAFALTHLVDHRGHDRHSMLARPARRAAGPLPVGDPPVELGGVEGLGRAVVAGQLGQLAGELGGQVAGLAAGQPLPSTARVARVARSACLRVSNRPRSLDLLDELVEVEPIAGTAWCMFLHEGYCVSGSASCRPKTGPRRDLGPAMAMSSSRATTRGRSVMNRG
jgi:hypothetical protein